jgi:ABC-type polysaccharide/polyol phosphate export permease
MLRDLRVRYKQAFFGVAWAVFMPALIVLSGVLVRFAVSQMTGAPFERGTIGALAVKGLGWGFFVAAIGVSTPSLTGNGGLITKVYFPREVLPLSAIFAQSVDTSVGAFLLLLAWPFLGAQLTVNILWLPLLAALLICTVIALGLILSCANVFFRDVKYIVQTLLTFGIFFTPVFYEPSMLGPAGAKLVMLNPLAPLLEGARLAVFEGHNLLHPLATEVATGTAVIWQPWYLLYSGACAVVGLIVGALIFHRSEALYPEYV